MLSYVGDACVHFHFGHPIGCAWIHIASKRLFNELGRGESVVILNTPIRFHPIDPNGVNNVVIYCGDSGKGDCRFPPGHPHVVFH